MAITNSQTYQISALNYPIGQLSLVGLVRCGRCGCVTTVDADSILDAEAALLEAGWWRNLMNEWVCPECMTLYGG